MPPYPAFLSRILRLQIRDWYLCCCDAVAARAFRPAGKRRGLSEVLAFRRLEVSTRDINGRGRGYDNTGARREYTTVIRTPARRIRRALTVGRLCQTPLGLLKCNWKPVTLFSD